MARQARNHGHSRRLVRSRQPQPEALTVLHKGTFPSRLGRRQGHCRRSGAARNVRHEAHRSPHLDPAIESSLNILRRRSLSYAPPPSASWRTTAPAEAIARVAADGRRPEGGFLRVPGARLEYRWIGPDPAEAPTLVFLHEGLGCAQLWRDVPDRLAARLGCGALVYSRAGFGRSSFGVLPWPLDYHEREAREGVPAVVRAAGIQRAILVGHSDGGTIALLYAAMADDPGLLGVITIAAHVFNEEETIRGIEAAKRAYRETAFRQRLARYHGANVSGVFWGWCDIWLSPSFRRWSVASQLEDVRVPVLALQGADDPYGTGEQVDTIVRRVGTRAEGVILAGCGHAPHLEQTEAVLDAIDRFARPLIADER